MGADTDMVSRKRTDTDIRSRIRTDADLKNRRSAVTDLTVTEDFGMAVTDLGRMMLPDRH